MNKKIPAVLCTLALMGSCLGVGAYAASNSDAIQATLSYGTQIKYNGATQQFKDANGNNVYPIVYNGTTYLPVRAVAGLFNTAVDWDGATGTVILGKSGGSAAVTKDIAKAVACCEWTVDKSNLVIDGQAYEAGFYSDEAGFCNTLQASLTLGGKYQSLHLRALNSRDAKLTIRDGGMNGTVLKTLDTKAGDSQEVTIDVGGIDTVYMMYAVSDSSWSTEGTALITDLSLQ